MKRLSWLLFSYKGRINRKVFWLHLLTLLFSTIIFGGIGIIVEYLPILLEVPIKLSIGAAFLVLVYTQLPITVKRLHDMDHSGGWIIFFMIPFIGFVALLMSCGIMVGTQGTNKYGEAPI